MNHAGFSDDWRDHAPDPAHAERRLASQKRHEDELVWWRGQAADRDGDMAWYVIAHRGAAADLMQELKAARITAWCPMRKRVERRGRGRRTVERTMPLFAGYVLVELLRDWEPAAYGIATFDAVIGLLGTAGKPEALPASTVEKLKEFEGLSALQQGVLFGIGRRVVITSGMFKGLEGRVVRPEDGNGELALELDIFGRLTPCRMGIDSVKRCD